MFYNHHALMRRAYGLAIWLSDQAARFERYAYNWLETFEAGEEWIEGHRRPVA